jgi:2-oxoisovalerate dehydrogenase E1 component alpha subunit
MPTRKKTRSVAESNGASAGEGAERKDASAQEEVEMVTTAEHAPDTAEQSVPRWQEVGLTPETLQEMYYYMLLARMLDERMWLLNRQGKAPFVISVQGHEAGQVGLGFAMEIGRDWFVPYYRDLALMLVAGQTPRDVMLSLFAKASEPNSGGRQMPGHYGFSKGRVLTSGSPVGTQWPHAAGIGLAAKLRKQGEVVAGLGGEGSTSQGDWHEAMNFAAIHSLPVLFVVENNKFAISVPLHLQMHIDSVAVRGAAYGMPGVSVDGTDPVESYAAVKEAVARARAGDGPTLLELRCIRITAHSSDDNDRTYRTKEEKEAERAAGDPVAKFEHTLIEQGIMTEAQEQEIRTRIAAEVNDATDFAETQPDPSADDTLKHVYATEEEVAAWRSKH